MDRFWKKVDVGGRDECWEWQASKTKHGYGHFWLDGRSQRAHRVVMRFQGHNIKDKHVAHHCDNPACVNPKHLWVGTHAENMRDMKEKGRANAPSGENHGQSKLTDEQVGNIRSLYEELEYTMEDISEMYDISEQYVWEIGNYEWRKT